MSPSYQRRSGGVSKTLVFADLITGVVAPTLGILVETGVLHGRWGYIALAVAGIVTRFLRQYGPVSAKAPDAGERL